MPSFPGPLKGLSIITEDNIEHPLMGTSIHPVFLDGTGIIPVRRLLEKAPFQQGMSDRGFRQGVRRMTLQLMLEGSNEVHADSLRDQVAALFVPTNSPIKLRAIRDDLTVRQIDCYVDGEIDFPQSTRQGAGQLVTVPLVAPNPAWYFATQQVTTSLLTEGTDIDLDISVAGLTADDWPVINITGPAAIGLTIRHYPGYAAGYTNHDFTLITAIAALETIAFDLRPGYKSARNQNFSNRMSYINPLFLGSFSEMRLMSEHTTRATDAAWTTTNRFRFNATGVDGNTRATIAYYKRYASL